MSKCLISSWSLSKCKWCGSEFLCNTDLSELRALKVNHLFLCVVPECDGLGFIKWLAFINAILDFYSMSKQMYPLLYRSVCSVLSIMPLGGTRSIWHITNLNFGLDMSQRGCLPSSGKYWVVNKKQYLVFLLVCMAGCMCFYLNIELVFIKPIQSVDFLWNPYLKFVGLEKPYLWWW